VIIDERSLLKMGDVTVDEEEIYREARRFVKPFIEQRQNNSRQRRRK
jgi:hypothetical protein